MLFAAKTEASTDGGGGGGGTEGDLRPSATLPLDGEKDEDPLDDSGRFFSKSTTSRNPGMSWIEEGLLLLPPPASPSSRAVITFSSGLGREG